MKSKPIFITSDLIPALLDGRKTCMRCPATFLPERIRIGRDILRMERCCTTAEMSRVLRKRHIN